MTVRGFPLLGVVNIGPRLKLAESCLSIVIVPLSKSTAAQVRPSSSEIRKPVKRASVTRCSILVPAAARINAADCSSVSG